MRIFYTFSIIILFITSSFTQGLDKLEASAKTFIQSIVEEDYATMVDLTYDNIIDMAGDKDYYVKLIKSNRESLKSVGMIMESATFTSSSPVVKAGDELHAIVSFNKRTIISDKPYEGTSYLLAITKDKGKTWKFVELETFDSEGIKDFVPNYNDNLPFPVQEGAMLVEK